MGFIDVGAQARLDRCIGYYEPYATSHDALDGNALTGMNWCRTNFAMAGAVAKTVVELRVGGSRRCGQDCHVRGQSTSQASCQ
jgi:hypothetical protein